MGEAKKRGSREDRVKQAEQRARMEWASDSVADAEALLTVSAARVLFALQQCGQAADPTDVSVQRAAQDIANLAAQCAIAAALNTGPDDPDDEDEEEDDDYGDPAPAASGETPDISAGSPKFTRNTYVPPPEKPAFSLVPPKPAP